MQSALKDQPCPLPVFHELEVCNVASDDHTRVDECEIVTRYCPDDIKGKFSVGLRNPGDSFFRMSYRDSLGEVIATRNLMIEMRRKELGFA